MPAHKRVTAMGRLVRENKALKDRLRRAERALKEGRSFESYIGGEAITVDDKPIDLTGKMP
jgi:hypothetical protein